MWNFSFKGLKEVINAESDDEGESSHTKQNLTTTTTTPTTNATRAASSNNIVDINTKSNNINYSMIIDSLERKLAEANSKMAFYQSERLNQQATITIKIVDSTTVAATIADEKDVSNIEDIGKLTTTTVAEFDKLKSKELFDLVSVLRGQVEQQKWQLDVLEKERAWILDFLQKNDFYNGGLKESLIAMMREVNTLAISRKVIFQQVTSQQTNFMHHSISTPILENIKNNKGHLTGEENETAKDLDYDNDTVNRVKELKRETQVLSEEKTQLIKIFQEKLQSQSLQIEQMKSQLEQIHAENGRLKKQLNEVHLNSNDSLGLLKKNLEEYQIDNDRLTLLVQNMQKDMDTEAQLKEDTLRDLKKQLDEQTEGRKYVELRYQESLQKVGLLNADNAEKQIQLREKENALRNLENTLVILQKDHGEKVIKLKKELKSLTEDIARLSDQLKDLDATKRKLSSLEEDNRTFSLKLQTIQAIEKETTKRNSFLTASLHDAIARINDANLVDRRILLRLLLTYFNAKEEKVLKLIASLMKLTEAETKMFNIAVVLHPIQNQLLDIPSNSRSLSELWIQFLLKESSEQVGDSNKKN